jgi:hypothetical protein
MSYARTHGLTGRGFGSKEMTFGPLAIEISLNAERVVIRHFTESEREGLTYERVLALHVMSIVRSLN